MNGEIIFPKKDELVVAGRLLKPHGIKGEISAGVEIDDLDLREVKCVVVEIEGIPVPFFPTAVRPKNHASVLVTLDGVTNESEPNSATKTSTSCRRMCPKVMTNRKETVFMPQIS